MYRKLHFGSLISIIVLVYSYLLFMQAYYHTPSLIEMGGLSKKLHKSSQSLIGDIVSDPQLLERPGGNTQLRFLFRVSEGQFAGSNFVFLLTNFVDNGAVDQSKFLVLPQVGETWRCLVQVRRAGGFRNPGAAHFGTALAAKNILGYGVTKEDWKNVCNRLQAVQGFHLIRQRVRQQILQAGQTTGRALALALLVGDRSELTPEVREPVALAGLSHVLAVSGMHVGIMAWLGFYFGQFAWRVWSGCRARTSDRAWWQLFGSLFLAGLYGLLSGFALPAQRAYIALVVVLLTKTCIGESSWSAALLGSVLAVLILAPWAPMTLDFWCSFGALTLLWLVFDRQHQRLGFWQALFKSQVLLTFGLLPAVILMTGQLSLLSPLYNAIVIPLLSFVVLPGLLLVLALSFMWLTPLFYFLDFLSFAVECLQQSMAAWPALIQLTLTHTQSLALTMLVVCWSKVALRHWFGWAFCCFLLTLLPWQRPAPNQFWVDVLDVGQGNGVLVRTRSHTLLYDAGARWRSGRDAAQAAILPFMRTQAIRSLDALVISHEDNDHVGGVSSLLTRYTPDFMVSSFDARALAKDAKADSKLLGCSRLQSWWWDGVLFQVFQAPGLAGSLNPKVNSSNNRSCILRVSFGDEAVLIPGDIEVQAENAMAAWPHLLQANLLVAPHHGSQTSSSTGFINRVNPDVVVFTAGELNGFGHPATEVVARYLVRGVVLHHAGEQGAYHWRSKRFHEQQFFAGDGGAK